MITSITIRGFKCFTDTTVPLRPLTVLTGINGAGKSSFIQTFLLAHLASESSGAFTPLNGRLQMRLGQAQDVLRGRAVEILLEHGEAAQARWSLAAADDESLVLTIEERPKPTDVPEGLRSGQFTYLEAERLGPRELLGMDSRPSDALGVGVQGEFTAHAIARHERKLVDEALWHPDSGPETVRTLGKQLEFWMRELVPGIEIRSDVFPSANAAALRLRKAGFQGDWLRATNMGFGLTYVLPIMVAGLLARPGSMLIVENPEAHLHPQGQSRVARFLATVASHGVQVLVETHSDHFLNGLRLACVDSHPIAPSDISILFFASASEQVRIEQVEITERGSLSRTVAGFFDQSESDLAAIIRARRPGVR